MKRADREVAGSIPIMEDGKIVFVSNSKGHYIIPKGGIEKNENPWEAAQREAFEEAGIEGKISNKIAGYIKDIPYFILSVLKLNENYDEKESRTRIILSKTEIFEHELVPQKIKDLLQSVLNE